MAYFGAKKEQRINMRIEYELTPIRHMAIQCPFCHNWFHGSDCTDSWIEFGYQLQYTVFTCPMCEEVMNPENVKAIFDITEPGGADEVYKGCKVSRTTWE